MLKNFYRLDYCIWKYFDKQDNEDVELRKVIGFFDTKAKLKQAKEICHKQGKIPNKYLQVKEYSCLVSNNQKFLYYLIFDYSVFDDNEYIDYLYIFQPFSCKAKCIIYKKELQKNEKFQVKPSYLYLPSKDGFWIEKRKINEICKDFAYNWKDKINPKDVPNIIL